jgi:hypothetical protein
MAIVTFSKNEKERDYLDFRSEVAIVWPTAGMDEQSDKEIANKKQRDQMLNTPRTRNSGNPPGA